MTAVKYCLQKDTLSVQNLERGGKECSYIPAGSVVSILDGAASNGFVEVEWDTKRVLMFDVDIQNRAEPLASSRKVEVVWLES